MADAERFKHYYDLGFTDGSEGLTGERVFRSKDDAESYGIGLNDGKAMKRAEEYAATHTESSPFDRSEAEEIRHGYLYGHYSEEHIRRYGSPS